MTVHIAAAELVTRVPLVAFDLPAERIERDQHLRGWIREAQVGPDRAAAVARLLAAFTPLLKKLWRKLGRGAVDDDEKASIILIAFIETVSGYPLDRRAGSVAVGLGWETRRAAVRRLRREVGERNFRRGLAAAMSQGEALPFGPSPEAVPTALLAAEQAVPSEFLPIARAAGLTASEIELICRNRIEGVSLGEIASELPAVRQGHITIQTGIERLRKRRSRALRRVKTHVASTKELTGCPRCRSDAHS